VPEHQRSALSDTADQMGMAAFAMIPLRSGTEFSGILGMPGDWSERGLGRGATAR